MNETHYGWQINCYWDAVNMLHQMKSKNPQRFTEFQYSETHIYDVLDKLQHQQNLHD